MKKKIAIIGSGVAGLVLGNLFKKNSEFECVIYEKDTKLNLEEGFGIQLGVNSVNILNKIGFAQIKKNEKFFPSKLNFCLMNDDKICDLNISQFNTNTSKYTTLKRSTLIKFLKEQLLSDSIIFNKKINNIKKFDHKINISFDDGSKDDFDYLIVSDGIFSHTKSIVEKDNYKANFNNSVAIRAVIKDKNMGKIDRDNISILMGSNAHIVFYPINEQKHFNLVCIIRQKLNLNSFNRLKDLDFIKLILKNTILKENNNLLYLLEEDLKCWPIYNSRKIVKPAYNNIFYVGDALYAFLPTMAQGAAQSIEAANELFELIINDKKDIQNEYLKNRIIRTNLVNQRSKLNYFIFHLSNPFLKILRNKILKLFVKNKIFINNYLGKIYK